MIRRLFLVAFLVFLVPNPILHADTNGPARDELYFSHDAALFPIPKALEPQVNFWIKIYSKYSLNQQVIHDSRNLSVIYEVFDIRDIFGSRKVSYRTALRYMNKQRRHWKSVLRQLASHRVNFDHLTRDQQKAFDAWGRKRDHSLYRIASRHVRAQRGQKERFRKGVQLSGRYLIYMKKVFRKMGLPDELTVIPHVESSFRYRAYSRVGAAGIWQFTRHTGRLFLNISYEVDERLDPILSTQAAAELLKKNYDVLGNWPLAITAYNHGLEGMKRAKRQLHTDDIAVIVQKYRSRKFKFASRNFYTEFLAALKVVESYEKYFGPVIYDPPIQFQQFKLPAFVSISTLEKHFGLSEYVIQEYNPALRLPVFVGNKYLPKGYKLRLPKDLNPTGLFATIPEKQLYTRQKRLKWYRVRRGDTISRIARRFHLRTRDVVLANNIRNVHRIRIGAVLYIPSGAFLKSRAVLVNRSRKRSANPLKPAGNKTAKIVEKKMPQNTAIKQPVMLAEKNFSDVYGPFVDNTPAAAPVGRDTVERTLPAYDVQLTSRSQKAAGWIRVEPDETLGHYADWLGVPTQRIRRWNRLSYGRYLQIGQRIKLKFETVSVSDFEEKRLEYHKSLEEDFFQNYKIAGMKIHKVRRGENIWSLCSSVYELPFWLVKSYNGGHDLFRLHPGDKIVIPEVVDRIPDEENTQDAAVSR